MYYKMKYHQQQTANDLPVCASTQIYDRAGPDQHL